MVFDAILEAYQLGTDMTERTANQAIATWAETEYETKQAWAKPSNRPVRKAPAFWSKLIKFFAGK